jgi:hypothetical protein
MFESLIDGIRGFFGCQHEDCGFPITHRAANGLRLTVRVCLECGVARKYDWARMRYVPFERGEERQLRAKEYGNGVIS